MSKLINKNLYTSKSDDYFSAARKEIIDLLPNFSKRTLEIGCGSGQTLELIKNLKLCESTVGIELFEKAAQVARTRVDKVYNLDIENEPTPSELGKFDLILILDVLEHLINPWLLLENIKKNHLNSDGVIIVSLPNARHFSCVFPLFFNGNFEYKNRGILDKTHLRFFTKKSGKKMVEDAGYTVEKVKKTSLDFRLNSGKFNAITLGIFNDFITSQYIYKLTLA